MPYLRRLLTFTFILTALISVARAEPLTYQFGGTLTQPFEGSSQFSGTFTYDTSSPLFGTQSDPTVATYSGALGTPMSATFTLGGLSSTSLGTPEGATLAVFHRPTEDAFIIEFRYPEPADAGPFPAVPQVAIGFRNNNVVGINPLNSTSIPSMLNLSAFNDGGQINYQQPIDHAQMVNLVSGTITSLQLVSGNPTPDPGPGPVNSVPKPTSLCLFGALGLGECLRRACRRIRRPSRAE